MRRIPRGFLSRDLKQVSKDLSSSFSGLKNGVVGIARLPGAVLSLWRGWRHPTGAEFLCDICKDLRPYGSKMWEYNYRQIDSIDLSLEIQNGCQICAILEAVTLRVLVPRFFRSVHNLRLRFDLLRKMLTVRPVDVFCTEPEVTLYNLEDVELGSLFSSPKAALYDTQSEESLHRVQSWIKTCTKEHSHCSSEVERPLPDRILDLGESGQEEINLYVTSNELATYACLSHCWGSFQPIRTLQGNLQDHIQGIAFSALPKTFQDAVTMCRRLSIRYLWIDSLCIIQDDATDWEQQAAKMASIYENAFLTIAATHSSSNQTGLHAHDPPYIHSRIPASEISNGIKADIYVRVSSSSSYAFSREGPNIPHWHKKRKYLHGNQDWPLLSRAWVFQERLLSPRMLHFGKHELVFECREGASCDCGQGEGKYNGGDDDFEFRRLVSARSLRMVDATPRELYKMWYSVVERYSQVMRNLTHETDVLPALSGLAKRISSLSNNDVYVAGLWKGDLCRGLLWFPRYRNMARPKRWRAPSWSWASTLNPVTYNPEDHLPQRTVEETYATVVDVECLAVGAEATGEIYSGRLTLRGPTLTATVTEVKQESVYDPETHNWVPRTGYWLRWDHDGTETGFHPDFDLPRDIIDGKRLVCLRMARYRSRDYYLVLRRIDSFGPALDVYERVGVVGGWETEWRWMKPESWYERVRSRLHEEERTVQII